MSRRDSVSVLQAVSVLVLCSGIIHGADSGLVGSYFDNQDFTNRKVVRLDGQVDFNWGNGSPAPEIGAETFSVRWDGEVETLAAGEHTFYTYSDDGVRLWVNGVLIIDNWTVHAPVTNTGTIGLVAGRQYSIRLDYYENLVGAVINLSWSSASQAKEIIPTSQLFGLV